MIKTVQLVDIHKAIRWLFYLASRTKCIGDILRNNFGNIEAELIYREVTAYEKTGHTQLAVMDFKR